MTLSTDTGSPIEVLAPSVSVGESRREADAQQEPNRSSERRRARRLSRDALPGLGCVTLVPREPAQLLNISSSGLLVSSARQLRVASSARFVLRGAEEEIDVVGRVVRCQVCSIDGNQGIAYATAIHYDRELELDRYHLERPAAAWKERRSHRRVPGPLEGTLMRHTGEIAITIWDLSEGGCLVGQPAEFSPGERCPLSIRLPNHDLVFVVGECLSGDPAGNLPVRFIEPEEAQRQALRRAVESLGATVEAAPGPEAVPNGGLEPPHNDW